MQKLLRMVLILCLLLGWVSFLSAQNYVGSNTCMLCHNNVNPTLGYNIWEEYMKSGHPYKLNPVNGAPPVYPANTSPGVPSAPPAAPNWSDYVYVIGGYGWKARFVKAADGKVFTSDPQAQWNLETQGWVAYNLGQDVPYNYSCFKCHTTGADPNGSWHPTTPNLGTFTEPGIRCEGCHGAGSDHVVNPTTVAPPIQGQDLQITRCGDCHQRGGVTNAIPASGGYIRHHEQINEMRASKHGDGVGPDLTCAACHDTHIPLRYPNAAGTGLNGIKTGCQTCHQGYEIMLGSGLPKPIDCTDCHMAQAGKSAVGMQVGNGWRGDVATHIWHINTDPVPRDSMFTSNGTLVKLNAEGLAAVTLDFACLKCHQTESLEWASYHAQNIHSRVLGVEPGSTIPNEFQLAQNYPNPFNPSTTIAYSLPRAAGVRLAVYNLLGQEVTVLVNGQQQAGSHTVALEGRNLRSGVYIYRLESEGISLSRKMILMR